MDPMNAAPGIMPLILETFIASVESVWKRPPPATSRVAAGAAVPMPTFDVEPWMIRVGVASCVVLGNDRAAAPVSKTMLPVV